MTRKDRKANFIADELVRRGLMKPHHRERASFIFGCCFDTIADLERASEVLEPFLGWEDIDSQRDDFVIAPQLVAGINPKSGRLTVSLELIHGEEISREISMENLFTMAQNLTHLGFQLYGVSGPDESGEE